MEVSKESDKTGPSTFNSYVISSLVSEFTSKEEQDEYLKDLRVKMDYIQSSHM